MFNYINTIPLDWFKHLVHFNITLTQKKLNKKRVDVKPTPSTKNPPQKIIIL
jgi:hypothetical protein